MYIFEADMIIIYRIGPLVVRNPTSNVNAHGKEISGKVGSRDKTNLVRAKRECDLNFPFFSPLFPTFIEMHTAITELVEFNLDY